MAIDMNSIGKRIKDRRKDMKLTQADIMHECGISSGALSEIEHGNRTPSIITFYALSQVLKCSMDWLATGESSNTKNSVFSECEDKLLCMYNELPKEEQEEIMEILDMKLRKAQKKKGMMGKSSTLTNTETSNRVG